MSFITTNYGQITVEKQVNMDVHPASESEKSNETSSDETSVVSRVYLNNSRGTKIDYIRVVNVLYELGFFTDDKGGRIAKKDVMKAFGNTVNIDLTNYDKDLSRSLSDSTAMEKHLLVFERMRDKMEEIFNLH